MRPSNYRSGSGSGLILEALFRQGDPAVPAELILTVIHNFEQCQMIRTTYIDPCPSQDGT